MRALNLLQFFTGWKALAAAGAVLVLTNGASYCTGRHQGAESVRKSVQAERAQVIERAAKATDTAAEQRITDTLTVSKSAQDRTDAYKAEPDARPSDARRAFNCERLRQAKVARLPAECGSDRPR